MNNVTKQTYEDPAVVEGYIKKNSLQPKQADLIKEFVKKIQGKKILDLGCGPGHDSYIFAELGFDVIGFDFSVEMIKQAAKLKSVVNSPHFIVGDMTNLSEFFPENEFDAVWASASLLHIRKDHISEVLAGIEKVSKIGAPIFISLKKGKGTEVVKEDVYAPQKEREFTFWDKDSFIDVASKFNLHFVELRKREGRHFNKGTTAWLQFFFENQKQ